MSVSSGPSMHPQKLYDWDEKLAEGKAGEDLVARWLAHECGGDSVFKDVRDDKRYQEKDIDFVAGAVLFELKTDYKAHETGNLYLELDALRKSRADVWLIYLPQRDWLFRFNQYALAEYAERLPVEPKRVFSQRGKRIWSAVGVPVRMSELLLKLPGTILYTGIREEVAAYDDE